VNKEKIVEKKKNKKRDKTVDRIIYKKIVWKNI